MAVSRCTELGAYPQPGGGEKVVFRSKSAATTSPARASARASGHSYATPPCPTPQPSWDFAIVGLPTSCRRSYEGRPATAQGRARGGSAEWPQDPAAPTSKSAPEGCAQGSSHHASRQGRWPRRCRRHTGRLISPSRGRVLLASPPPGRGRRAADRGRGRGRGRAPATPIRQSIVARWSGPARANVVRRWLRLSRRSRRALASPTRSSAAAR